MNDALLVIDDNESCITAEEFKRQYGGRLTFANAELICPYCHRPVIPCAMKGAKRSAHFKHKRNDEAAHNCERYASISSHKFEYRQSIIPIYIRNSKDNNNKYIIDIGFKSKSKSIIEELQNDDAKIVIGTRTYKINHKRFGDYETYLPIDEVKLNLNDVVYLENTPYSLEALWGVIQEAIVAIIFSSQKDLLSQANTRMKRVNLGESIQDGSYIYLVVPSSEKDNVCTAFPDAICVGTTGSYPNEMLVFYAEFRNYFDESRAYLERCGYKTVDSDRTPHLVWPPSLISDYDYAPIIYSPACVLTLNTFESNDTLKIQWPNGKEIRKEFESIRENEGGFLQIEASESIQFLNLEDEPNDTIIILYPTLNILSFDLSEQTANTTLIEFFNTIIQTSSEDNDIDDQIETNVSYKQGGSKHKSIIYLNEPYGKQVARRRYEDDKLVINSSRSKKFAMIRGDIYDGY